MNYIDIILNECNKRLKEKCREVNPMSMNFSHIDEVILEVKKEINKFIIDEYEYGSTKVTTKEEL